jgi:hypothetical protein
VAAPPKQGYPTWVWIVVALAILGVVALIALKR